MVTVSTGDAAKQMSSINPMGLVRDIFALLSNPFVIAIMICVVILIILIVIIIWLNSKDKQRKIEEDGMYRKYIEIKQQCRQNARKEWIQERWSLLNLIFFPFFPIGWIPMFMGVFKKELSFKIYDADRNFMGYYRGETHTNGEWIIAYYREKDWFVFPNIKLVRLMEEHRYETYERDPAKNNEIVYEKIGNVMRPKTRIEIVKDFAKLHIFGGAYDVSKISKKHYKWLEIQCEGFKITNQYYYTPNYFFYGDNGERVFQDFTVEYHQHANEMTLTKLYDNTLTKQTEIADKIAQSNPDVAKGRRMVEKTEDETSTQNNKV